MGGPCTRSKICVGHGLHGSGAYAPTSVLTGPDVD